MKKLNQDLEWQVVAKKGVNFENLLISIVARSFIECNKQKKIFGPFYTRYYRQFKAHRDFLKKDIDKFIRKARATESEKPGSILRSYYDFEDILNKAKKLANILHRFDFSEFDNQKLAQFLKKYMKISGSTICYDFNYYFFQYIGDELFSVVQKKEKDVQKQAKIFEILTQAKIFSNAGRTEKIIMYC